MWMGDLWNGQMSEAQAPAKPVATWGLREFELPGEYAGQKPRKLVPPEAFEEVSSPFRGSKRRKRFFEFLKKA